MRLCRIAHAVTRKPNQVIDGLSKTLFLGEVVLADTWESSDTWTYALAHGHCLRTTYSQLNTRPGLVRPISGETAPSVANIRMAGYLFSVTHTWSLCRMTLTWTFIRRFPRSQVAKPMTTKRMMRKMNSGTAHFSLPLRFHARGGYSARLVVVHELKPILALVKMIPMRNTSCVPLS